MADRPELHNAGKHGEERVGAPKMPGEPPRVQPSKKVAANWDEAGIPV